MNELSLGAVDLLIRGGVCLVLLLVASLLLRDHGRVAAARLGAFFAAGTATYAIASAASFHGHMGWWGLPLLMIAAGNNVVFWLFACALFDDGFRLRRRHGAVWLGVVVLGSTCALVLDPEQKRIAAAALTLTAFGFAALAVWQTVADWRADLVEPRRRLRVFIVAASASYIGLNAAANLLGSYDAAPLLTSVIAAGGLAVIAGGVAWSLLGVGPGEALFPAAQAQIPVPPPAIDGGDQRLIVALERAMAVDRIYRQEALTIGDLAERLGIPEYRLRRLINQGLGHRNFNSFLNGHRIAEAKAALADPAQAAVPILTIALDAGFGSLGPFNRAFKAETGVTPTEYRRAPADSGIGEAVSVSARPLSKSA
ncbi:AraC family transcriptional regulator [Oleomonas cavernae]|uniref:AraC family transcriptional regulator n=1 Tax=Oleomonas cavernae TaxID=2320859 RepID=A0A418WCU0_9PROT|nr:AraC family transcriptional regulator [Oleomonas cavernae]RJF87843.1 AraC family transcriptional regulator [Oleomonas cavernae]